MRERKYIRFRCDMYEDTKFKIIDMKPERDMIHYVWTRLLTLAGKVNMAGELYMSRNLPYTIETLAIEFNRDKEQVKLALGVFIELEMIEVTEESVYRVKNFAKHQNIKVEEKVKSEDKEDGIKDRETAIKSVVINKTNDNEEKKSEDREKSKESENNMNGKINDNISQNSSPIPFEAKKNKKVAAKKKKKEVISVTDEEYKTNEIACFGEGEFIPGEGDEIISSWTF